MGKVAPSFAFFGAGAMLAPLLLVAGCSDAPDQAQAAPKAIPVRVADIGTATNKGEINVIGTAAWRKETALGFTTDGQIDRILVNEGDRVGRGQLLAVLKTTPVAAELSAAEAEAARASGEYGRMQELFGQGWVTRQRLEAAEAASRSANAAVRARRFALDTARINAPSAGVILSRQAEPNQVVGEGTPILMLGEAGSGYVLRAPLNDRAAARLTVGLPAQVRFEALGAPLEGKIVEIGAKADGTTGTFDIEIALPADPRIRSGMIGSATVVGALGGEAAKPLLPASALLSPRAGEAIIYVLGKNNRAVRRTVQIGEAGDGGVEVRSGLSAGEAVIVSNLDRLRDGALVTPSRLR
jgi:RND family efflux transporter MFP subunit